MNVARAIVPDASSRGNAYRHSTQSAISSYSVNINRSKTFVTDAYALSTQRGRFMYIHLYTTRSRLGGQRVRLTATTTSSMPISDRSFNALGVLAVESMCRASHCLEALSNDGRWNDRRGMMP